MMKTISYDVVVVGGGMSGICAAIASARGGAKTALIHNRPVLGGNASSEIRMHICGADHHGSRENARETGILDEILSKNKARNPHYAYPIWDAVLWESSAFEPGLTLYLNTHMTEVHCENGEILSIDAQQLTTECAYCFCAPLFVDATGDGTLGAKAGADFLYGRESRAQFAEPDAQDNADGYTMGNSLMFSARDMGQKVPFHKPFWANSYTEEDLALRNHGDASAGYWWIELGGKDKHTIFDSESIRDDLLRAVYGVWDHIKNSGNHGAENYELDWVGYLPGKRESRRLLGDYVLTEQDCLNAPHFADAVAYGGWPMDAHVIDGFATLSREPTRYIHLDEVYAIPYRCLYSKNVANLFLAGRAVSATHLAFASLRVMGTCAVIGQAVGTAAGLCIQKGLQPRALLADVTDLQQKLLRDDCFIPGMRNEDGNDLARSARITASSFVAGHAPENVANGIARAWAGEGNSYLSESLNDAPQWLLLELGAPKAVRELHIIFDNNLSREMMITLIPGCKKKQIPIVAPELVKDYAVEFLRDGETVSRLDFSGNDSRFQKISLEESVLCDGVKLTFLATNFHPDYDINRECRARVFEVRVYGN